MKTFYIETRWCYPRVVLMGSVALVPENSSMFGNHKEDVREAISLGLSTALFDEAFERGLNTAKSLKEIAKLLQESQREITIKFYDEF